MLYEVIDTSGGYYTALENPACSSRVKAPFVIKGDDAALTLKFLAGAEAGTLSALAGHRSIGGCSASLYNALPGEAVAKWRVYTRRFQEANPLKKNSTQLPHDMAISLFYLGYAKEDSSRQCISCWAKAPARATPS